jgi:hypothetical protein
MKRLQPQEANVAASVAGVLQGTTVDIPADGTQPRHQAMTIIARIDHEQTTQRTGFDHD